MKTITDQIGYSFKLKESPIRIICLVPSLTEYLFSLGLNDEVVGITKFCIHPQEWFKSKERIGGTKNIKLEIVDQLQPDLIIANKEENTKEDIELLQKKHLVYTTDIITLEQCYEALINIGALVGRLNKAKEIVEKIKSDFSLLPHFNNMRIAYFIWQKPYMLAGGDTFINTLLEKIGFYNVAKDIPNRYPEITISQLKSLNPELLLLSSEPFPFKEKHKTELEESFDTKALLIDGEILSWYGSRLTLFFEYAKSLQKSIKKRL